MRWFARIFANAVARRVVFIVVATLLSALGFCGKAHAADQGSAFAACQAFLVSRQGPNVRNASCELDAAAFRYRAMYEQRSCSTCAWGSKQSFGTFTFDAGASCANRANAINAGFTFRPGSSQCVDGCTTSWSPNEGGGSTGITTGEVCDKANWTCPEGSEGSSVIPGPNDSEACEPPLPECPEGQEKVDGVCKHKETCPSGQHTNQRGECEKDSDNCPAGQTKGPDGSCLDNSCPTSTFTGSNGTTVINQVKGKDGTCKADADGDGKADDEQDDDDPNKDGKEFSGGDSCDAPPTCSGDAIACGQARIQWRIDCNTRADAKISGGSCAAMPVCTGKNCKAAEYSQLIMQWRTACAVEKLAAGEGGTSEGGDPNIKDIRDQLMPTSPVGSSAGDDPSGAWVGGGGSGDDDVEPDRSGYGYGGGSCPTVPPIDVLGTSVSIDITPLCQWVSLGGKIVLALAALACARIISGRAA